MYKEGVVKQSENFGHHKWKALALDASPCNSDHGQTTNHARGHDNNGPRRGPLCYLGGNVAAAGTNANGERLSRATETMAILIPDGWLGSALTVDWPNDGRAPLHFGSLFHCSHDDFFRGKGGRGDGGCYVL